MYRCTGALKSRLKARGGSSAACVAVPGAAEPSSAGTQPALHAAPPKPDHATHALQRFSRAHVTGVRTVAAAGSAPRSACWPRRPSASRGGGGCVDGAGALARDFEGAAVSAWVGRGRSSAIDPGPPARQGRRLLPRHGPGGRGGRGRGPRPHAQPAVAAWQPGRRRLRRRFRAGAPRTLAPQPPCPPGACSLTRSGRASPGLRMPCCRGRAGVCRAPPGAPPCLGPRAGAWRRGCPQPGLRGACMPALVQTPRRVAAEAPECRTWAASKGCFAC